MGENIEQERIRWAESNLERKLDWISRYDSRSNFVGALSITMLGVLGTISGSVTFQDSGTLFIFFTPIILLLTSIVFIYYSQYPDTKSTQKSLLFFGTIAKFEVEEFHKAFKVMDDEQYLSDLINQIHVNSRRLEQKFVYLKISVNLIIISLIPWVIAIYTSKLMFIK